MKTFIQVVFWLGIIEFVARIILISKDDYPRQQWRKDDCWYLAINLPFLAWAMLLLWGKP